MGLGFSCFLLRKHEDLSLNSHGFGTPHYGQPRALNAASSSSSRGHRSRDKAVVIKSSNSINGSYSSGDE